MIVTSAELLHEKGFYKERACREVRSTYLENSSYNIPHVFSCMTEFAASNTGAETVIADRDGFVLESICKVILALCHGSDKDTYAFLRVEILNIVSNSDNFSIETECDLATIRWQMVCDRVLDNLEQLLLRIDRSYRQLVQQLYHQTSEPLECSRNSNGR